jgi:hypothetical protein
VRTLAACALAATLLAGGGCIFSSDEDPSPPASAAWAPEFHVTPDSVYAWFPADFPDTLTWNRAGRGVWEYVLEASVPVGQETVHLAFAHESNGGPPQRGGWQDLVADGYGVFWIEDVHTGEYVLDPRNFARVWTRDGGIVVTTWFSTWLYGKTPPRTRYWTITFVQRGYFDYRKVQRSAEFVPDVAQDRAREVEGPLSADDYAVLDAVLRAFLPNAWPSTAVVSTSQRAPGAYFDRSIDGMGADHDTRAAFEVAGRRTIDLSALAQLGYTMVDEEGIVPGSVLYLGVSGIGYNHRFDQALVYATTYCGGLCAEGDMFLLEKVGGYWIIRDAVLLWIS